MDGCVQSPNINGASERNIELQNSPSATMDFLNVCKNWEWEKQQWARSILPSGKLTDVAIENGPFIVDLPIENGDFA